MKNIFFTGILSLTIFTFQAQINLVKNGSFEGKLIKNVPENWQSAEPEGTVTAAMISTVTSGTKDGLKALKYGIDSTDGRSGSIFQYVYGFEDDKKYTFSFWYKFTAPDDGNLPYSVLQWQDENANELPYWSAEEDSNMQGDNVYIPYAPKNVWKQRIFTITAPKKIDNLPVFLYLEITSGNANMIIDDVKIIDPASLGTNNNFEAVDLHIENNTVYVATNLGEAVGVYNLLGQQIVATKANDTTTVLSDLPVNHILIVRAGSRSGKCILK